MAQQQHQSCIEACDACAAACDHCATACLSEQKMRGNLQEMRRRLSGYEPISGRPLGVVAMLLPMLRKRHGRTRCVLRESPQLHCAR